MSAIAQYLNGIGKNVTGSDRFFKEGEYNEIKEKLEAEGIKCFLQNGEGIMANTDLIVVSTAVEDTVIEVQKAKELNIPIIKRSELLAVIADSKQTITVGGTSGKSTTSAMLFDILESAGLQPSIISGAGLVSIIKQGKIGNAKVGIGVPGWSIEADESDGSIVEYKPEIGLLLNIDKDHKEIEVLLDIFRTFKENSKRFVVNQSHALAEAIFQTFNRIFPGMSHDAGFKATGFEQEGLSISFKVNNIGLKWPWLGSITWKMHWLLLLSQHRPALTYKFVPRHWPLRGHLYRRHQVLGNRHGAWVIDDFGT